jgi:hypothetical protein
MTLAKMVSACAACDVSVEDDKLGKLVRESRQSLAERLAQ